MNWTALTYDRKLLRGDPMLILSMCVPFILATLMILVFPLVEGFVASRWSYDICIWYRHVGYFFALLIPMMTGMVYGFILLDERDEGVITALAVTPGGRPSYLKNRLTIPGVLSFVMVVLFFLLLGLKGEISLPALLILSFVIGNQSLMMLLFLGAFASNKIVGLAISKGFGVLLMGPLLDFFLPGKLSWLGAYSPMFWTGRAFMAEEARFFLLYLLFSILYHAILIVWLYRRFLIRSN
jgi:fluoroquinolone transport system permease protein